MFVDHIWHTHTHTQKSTAPCSYYGHYRLSASLYHYILHSTAPHPPPSSLQQMHIPTRNGCDGFCNAPPPHLRLNRFPDTTVMTSWNVMAPYSQSPTTQVLHLSIQTWNTLFQEGCETHTDHTKWRIWSVFSQRFLACYFSNQIFKEQFC